MFRTRTRRLWWIIAATVAAVFISATAANGAPPKATIVHPPKAPQMPSVAGVHPFASRPMPATAKATTPKPVHVTWPAAHTTTIGLAAVAVTPSHIDTPDVAAPATQRSYLPVHGTGAPVWAQATSTHSPTSVTVAVQPQSTAQALGIHGVILTAHSTGTGPVTVGVDYRSFDEMFGGGWAQSLGLVELPACALTTPTRPACQVRTPLRSTNNADTETVAATVSLTTTASPVPTTASASPTPATVTPAGAPAQSGLVLALTATTPADGGGSTGTFAATSLKASGSWSEGGDTGSFDWSYPITMPPAASALTPDLSLSYSSSSVDGENATSNYQSSWAGDGWSTPDSFIEETYVPCANSPEGSPGIGSTDEDMCYDGKILTMSLAGSTSSLVWDDATSTWREQNDNGAVIVQKTGTTNGTYDGDYWQVTETDGTVYDFGLNELPGWSSGKSTTNSVDTEPVYFAHQANGTTFTDPYYNATFASSVKTMAYRWNLDYVVDVHHNAMAYVYQAPTNYYAADGKTTVNGVVYTRDSYLSQILYGFVDPNFYTTTPPDEVTFTTGDRCITGTCDPLNATNAANWYDLPYTDICAVSTHCTLTSPTFFSENRLKTITTAQYNGTSYVPVDTWTLGESMPKPSDMTARTLELDSIVREGFDTSASHGGAAITLPPVSFTYAQYANRVDTTTDGLGALERFRISKITAENGAVTTVTYYQPTPCTPPVTLTPATNTSSCYPVDWTPPGKSMFMDWFNVWSVQSISAADPFSSGTVTSYQYLGGAAYHYDDNETVQAKYRTYGQFRGYAEVQTRTGNPADGTTLDDAIYYRGMSNDDNNGVTVNITDSQAGQHTDLDQLAGDVAEDTTYTADTTGTDGGVPDHSTVTSYWVSPATATHSRSAYGLPALTANKTDAVESWTRQRITSGGTTTWRYLEKDVTYNAAGLQTEQYTHTVPANSAYDSCTTTTYATTNTTVNLVGLVAEAEIDQMPCANFTEGTVTSVPATVNAMTQPAASRPADVISDQRTFYDNQTMAQTWPQPANPTWPQAMPTVGNVSVTQQATDTVNGQPGYGYTTSAAYTYDSYGRALQIYSGAMVNGVPVSSTTQYTMANGVVTAVTLTDGAGHQTTNTYDPYRNLELTSKDPNAVITTAWYDALGRTIDVWNNSRTISQSANAVYSYTLGTATTPTVTTTKTLNDESGYITSMSFQDGLYRPIETQTPTPAGGRDVGETFYDTHGWVVQKDAAWWDTSSTPSTTLVTSNNNNVPNYDVVNHDGMGRATVDTSYDKGVAQYKSGTIFYGDSTTTIPPTGASATTTKVNPAGQTTELDTYTVAPTLTVTTANGYTTTTTATGGTSQTIIYGYDRRGHRNSVVAGAPDPGNQTWTTTYNLLGQVVSKTDPVASASTMTYDGAGNLQEVTSNAPNVPVGQAQTQQSLYFTYDALNRKTAEYNGTSTSAPMLASWTYDTAGVPDSLGHVVSATEYDSSGDAYTDSYGGFNTFGEPTSQFVTIPTNEGDLAGSYEFDLGYSSIQGLPSGEQYPASPDGGALPAELVTDSTVSAMDLPSGVDGNNLYTTSTSYDGLGRTTGENLGTGTGDTATILNTYYEHSELLDTSTIDNTSGNPIDAIGYVYDPTGNITQQTDTRNGTTTETQCYQYNGLDRLTEAWTATDNCATDPATDNGTTVGDPVAGGAYWTNWAFNTLGDRETETDNSLTGGSPAITNSTFNPAQPDTLTATATTIAGTNTANTSYTYDADGNMLTRDTPTGNEALTWNSQGQLATTASSNGTTTYLYDATGNLLLRKDPTNSTTLFLPGEQLVWTTTTHTISGTRYIGLPGGGEVVETGSGTNYTYEFADQHGSADLTLDHTAQTPTWRQFTPYGAPRGTIPGTWPDHNGFLGDPTDTTTGLTTIGAREYDPTIGRFITLDPVLETNDPNQLGGYTYAGDNPATHADPTGTMIDKGCGESGCGEGPIAPSEPPVCNIGHLQQAGCNNQPAPQAGPIDVPFIPTIGLIRQADPDFGYNNDSYFTAVGKYWGYWCGLNAGSSQSNADECNYLQAQFHWYNTPAGIAIADSLLVIGGFTVGYIIIPACIAGGCEAAGAYCIANPLVCNDAVESAVTGKAPLFIGGAVAGGLITEMSDDAGNTVNVVTGLASCSFAPDTPVLMADGAAKPISQVHIGDEVKATDPITGKTKAEPVTALHDNLDTDLTDVVVKIDQTSAVLHTTTNHPFWDKTTKQWTTAGDLLIGDQLETGTKQTATVQVVHTWTGEQDRRNLTVNQFHTYYVIAGSTPVLVHNTCDVPFRDDTSHIFRNADGHFQDDTAANRAVIQGAIDPANLRSTITLNDGSTLQKYFVTLPDGTQAWAEVRNGVITNGGLNQTPR